MKRDEVCVSHGDIQRRLEGNQAYGRCNVRPIIIALYTLKNKHKDAQFVRLHADNNTIRHTDMRVYTVMQDYTHSVSCTL